MIRLFKIMVAAVDVACLFGAVALLLLVLYVAELEVRAILAGALRTEAAEAERAP
jgi:hypothetical protein